MAPTQELVTAALATVIDPEIRRPITDLGMVKSVDISPEGAVRVGVYLTVAGCPMKDTIRRDVVSAVSKVDGVTGVELELDVMSTEQRKELQTKLRGNRGPEKEIPFNQPGSLTRVFAVASGKGGVGKSSVTVNLAASMAAQGLKVGIVDADIYGHSIPRMLGASERPTKVEDMIMPPVAHDIKVISVGMFKPEGNSPSSGAGRCSTARSTSSWPMSTGATSTSCCSTCPLAPATSRSRSRSACRAPRSSW